MYIHNLCHSLQDRIEIGNGIQNTISYTVVIGSQSLMGVQCNTSNQCNLTVPGSQLTQGGLLSVSVVASNAVGNGNPVIFPMSGRCKLCTCITSLVMIYSLVL